MEMTYHFEKRKAGYNSSYPKGGVSCFADSLMAAESSILRMKFCGKNPSFRVDAKSYAQY